MMGNAAFWMRNNLNRTLLFKRKNVIVSCCTFELVAKEYAEMYLLATSASERKHGLATRIVGQIVKMAWQAACEAVIASV